MTEARRSEALREHLSRGVTDPPTLALIDEIARVADRLDELDRVIEGKGVLNLMRFRLGDDFIERDGTTRVRVEVRFDQVLAEARQQQATFRQLVLDVAKVTKASGEPAQQKGSPLDEFSKRLAERGAGAKGRGRTARP